MMCQIPLQEKTGNEAEACGRPAETEKKRGAIINRSIEKQNLYVLCDIERALSFGMYGKKKKKKARRELMPTPITRLRVRPLIGQTEMFPPVTKSHHPSVKHTQSSAYRFTHYSYILTCRSQTVLQRSNANMGAGVPLRERHDSPPRPIPGIIMPLHFSGHQIVKTQRNKERRSCLVDKLQQREIRCFRCV